MIRTLLGKLRALLHPRSKEEELREELEFHLAEEAEERQANGLNTDEARWAARRDLGNPALTLEETRAAWTWTFLEQFIQDVRYAWRTMRKSPGFVAVAVLSMALGIGANTAIFSFMDSILLRSLPVADPDSLVVLNWHSKDYPGRGAHVMQSMSGSTYADPKLGMTTGIFPHVAFELLAKQDAVFSSLFAHYPSRNHTLQIKGQSERGSGFYVSGDFFRGLAVVPTSGRLIVPDDDRAGATPVVVVSHAYANRRFGGPIQATGQSILIDNVPFVVAGVTPPEFFGVDPGKSPDFYVPMHTDLIIGGSEKPEYANPNSYWVEIMGRLRPGVTMAQAQAVLAPQFHQWVMTTATTDVQRTNIPQLYLREGAAGLDSLRRQYSKPLYLLLSIVALILALACANTANLLLARAAARRREMAVRLSMGAGRWRVMRQLLTESVLLASLGGALGILIAVWGMRFLTLLLANGRENFTLHAELNWNVLGVTVGLSLLSGILFGLAPAIQSTRTDVLPALKQTRGAVPKPRARFALFRMSLSHALVVLQIGISLLILLGAGLFVRTLSNLQSVHLGFNHENLVLFQLNARQAGHKDPELQTFYADLRDRFGAIPGVRGATLSHASLLKAGRSHPITVAGAPAPRGTRMLLTGSGFFSTMQIPMLIGREFDERDRAASPGVAIVNELFARTQFGNENPIGRRIKVGRGEKERDLEIIGVSANARYGGLKRDIPPVVFVSYHQATYSMLEEMTYALRTSGDPAPYIRSVREIVDRADRNVPVTDVMTQAVEIDRSMNQEIVFARLCTGFAILALVIACVGLYGVMSYNVARRTGEIGIRMALGAARGRVVWMVLRDVAALAIAGLAIGLPVAMSASKLVETFLFGMKPNDPMAITGAVLILVVAVLLAGFLPARRASRIEPMVALRQE